MLTKVFGTRFCGQTFRESLPPRLLYMGESGSGKTTRLRAIALALGGQNKSNGLRAFAMHETDAVSCGVGWNDGNVVRASEIFDDGRIKNHHYYENTEISGEAIGKYTTRKADSVRSAMDHDLCVNLLTLDLPAFLAKTGKERRKMLLTMLAARSAVDLSQLLRRLGEKVGDTDRNKADASMQSAMGAVVGWFGEFERDQLDAVAALEIIDKRCLEKYKLAERRFKDVSRPEPLTKVLVEEGLDEPKARKELEEIDTQLQAETAAEGDMKAVRARMDATEINLEKHTKEIIHNLNVLHIDIEVEKTTAANIDKAVSDAKTALLDTADQLRRKIPDLKAAEDAAVEKRDGKVTRHAFEAASFELMQDAIKRVDESEPVCPVCQETLNVVRVRELIVRRDTHRMSRDTVLREIDQANAEVTDANDEISANASDIRHAELMTQLAEGTLLLAVELGCARVSLSGLRAEAPATANQEGSQSMRQRRLELMSQLTLLGRKKERDIQSRQRDARRDQAVGEMRAWKHIRDRAGPKHLSSQILLETVAPVMNNISTLWFDVFGTTLQLEVADARGNPTVDLHGWRVRESGERAKVSFAALSGGEQAIALASFTCGLATALDDKSTVLLIDAGELSANFLIDMIEAMPSNLANVAVASHVGLNTEDQDRIQAAVFETRYLPAQANNVTDIRWREEEPLRVLEVPSC